MKIMRVDVRAGRVETESTDVLVLTHCEGDALSKQTTVIDKTMGGVLRDLLQSKEFEGKSNELALVHTHGKVPAKRILLVGLGKEKDVTVDQLRQAMGHAVKRVQIGRAHV